MIIKNKIITKETVVSFRNLYLHKSSETNWSFFYESKFVLGMKTSEGCIFKYKSTP